MPVIRVLGDIPDDAVLQEAARAAGSGGVLAVPTETFYALAVSARDHTAIERVKNLKGRADDKPIPVLIADVLQIRPLTQSIPAAAAILMETFWPGPLTLTFPAAADLSKALVGQNGAIGIRQPGHGPLLAVLRRTGPLTGTSANRAGEPPSASAADVWSVFGQSLDLILDGGKTAGGMASTVVDTVESVRIIREGPISTNQIAMALRRIGITLEGTAANKR